MPTCKFEELGNISGNLPSNFTVLKRRLDVEGEQRTFNYLCVLSIQGFIQDFELREGGGNRMVIGW